MKLPVCEKLFSPCLTSRAALARVATGLRCIVTSIIIPLKLFSGLLLLLSAQVSTAELRYLISEIETGNVLQQSALAANIGPGTFSDLIVVTVDGDNQRRWQLYQQNNGRYVEPVITGALDSDIVVMDTGSFAGRDVVLGFTRNAVFELDLYEGGRRHLADISSVYSAPVRTVVPVLDLFRDINGDGRDDLVVPDFSGYLILTQTETGQFDPPVHAAAPPLVEISFNNYPWYQPRRSYLADLTLDGLDDLVFFGQGGLIVYAQQSSSRFSADAVVVPTVVPVEFGSMEDMSVAMRDQDQSDSTTRALADIADMDGDGLPDLVTLSVKSEGVFKKRTTYEIHPGIRVGDALVFANTASAIIESKGFQFEAIDHDFDGDGARDMFISAVEVGIGKIIAALLTGSTKIDLNFYRMNNGTFDTRPDLRRDITATFDLGSGDFFIPTVLVTDADGDGIDDLMLQEGDDLLKIYRGTGDERLFARDATEIRVAMPNDPDLVQVMRLNSDNRSDLVMRIEPTSGPRKLVVMVSVPAD